MKLQQEQKISGLFRFCENEYRFPSRSETLSFDNDKGFQGHLTIHENGHLDLEIEGVDYSRFGFNPIRFPRIEGETTGKSIILIDCDFGHTVNLSGGNRGGVPQANMKLKPRICMIRQHKIHEQQTKPFFVKNDSIKFDKIRFSMEGMESFVRANLNGFVTEEFERWHEKHKDMIRSSIEYRQHYFVPNKKVAWNEPDPLILNTKNFKLTIESKEESYHRETITPQVYCVLEFSKPICLEGCITRLEGVHYFLSCIFDRYIDITNIFAYLSNQKTKIYVDDATDGHHNLISDETVEYPVFWNLYYDTSILNSEASNRTDNPIFLGYRDFFKNGKNILGSYIEPFVKLYENDEHFKIYFRKYLFKRFLSYADFDLFKSLADDCEYLFYHYNEKLPYSEKIKGKKSRNKKGIIVWKGVEQIEFWKKIRLLSKPFIGDLFKNDNECVNFAKEVKEYRNMTGMTHYSPNKKISMSHGKSGSLTQKIQELTDKLNYISLFHFLNLLHDDQKFNLKLVKKIHNRKK